MPEPKTITSLSGSVESDMDDELENAMPEAFPTPESNQENNVAPVRKGRPRGKAAAAKFTKTKAPARGVSGGAAVTKKKAAPKKKAAGKRQPLKEQTNIQHGSDTEEVDDFEAQKNKDADSIEDVSVEEEVKKQPVKRKPAARGKKKAEAEEKEAGTEVEAPNQTIERDGEFEYTPTVSRRSRTVAKPAGAVHKAVAGRSRAAKEIPETQTEPMEVEPSSLHMDEDVIPQSVYRQTSNFRAHSNTRQPPAISRRTGNASDAERTSNDPALRRKLGDLTKKLESMELKYNNLREVGIREAESNFEKLKVQSEAKTKAANDLIASLKTDLAAQNAVAQEAQLLTKQIATKDADLTNANAKADLLTTSLTEAQNEIKALQAKLANVRNAPVAVESVHAGKTPGSAVKGKAPVRTVMVGSAEAAQAAQLAQLKEDLYSDLTGLIMRGVEKGEEADIYDCIQTGRNGTLHFKLSVANDTESPYDDADMTYTPLLDMNRDREILQLMPDYLTEEITFSRNHAAQFYGRVVDTLMKKQRVMSEEE